MKVKFIDNIEIEWMTVIVVLSVSIIAFVISRLTRWIVNKSFMSASKKLKVDATRYKFFKNAASLIIWIIALGVLTMLIPKLKALAVTLFAGAGIMVVIIGLAAQQAFSNIVSGIFIVVFRPFRVGDMIKVGTLEYGVVEDITLRHTVIKNFENKRIIIPNSVISSETIVNDTIEDMKICKWIEIGISYDSNLELAMEIMREESLKHDLCIDSRTTIEKANNDPIVKVRLINFEDSSLKLRAEVWTNEPFEVRQMSSDICIAVKKRFDKEGIEIPFPYRTIVYKNEMKENGSKKSK